MKILVMLILSAPLLNAGVFPTGLGKPSYEMFVRSHFMVTPVDTVIIKADQSHLVIFDLHTGDLDLDIFTPEATRIASFAYLPEYDYYLINLFYPNEGFWQTYVYNRKGNQTAVLTDPDRPGLPVFIHQFITVDGRYFLNDLNGPAPSMPTLLQEVRFHQSGDQLLIEKVGRAFGKLLRVPFGAGCFDIEFRMKWLSASDGELYAANELENHIVIYRSEETIAGTIRLPDYQSGQHEPFFPIAPDATVSEIMKSGFPAFPKYRVSMTMAWISWSPPPHPRKIFRPPKWIPPCSSFGFGVSTGKRFSPSGLQRHFRV